MQCGETRGLYGYKKFNDIPVDSNITVEKTPVLTKEEILKKKFYCLIKTQL